GATFGFQDAAPRSPGDVNGDGFADVYANGFQQNGPTGNAQGKGWVFNGHTGALLYGLADPTPQHGGQFGWSMAGTDYNKDGTPDLYVGASPHHEAGATGSGQTVVFDGHDGSVLRSFPLPGADVQASTPTNLGPNLGWGLGAPGDLNGDGEPDYVGGAPFLDVGSTQDQGAVYVFQSARSPVGYTIAAADGGVFPYGAGFFGSAGATPLAKPVVATESTPDQLGYWLVASDGGVFSYGDARFFGSTGAMRLNRPVVGMAATPSGKGYWLVASDGGVFSFGDARFFGSTGAMRLNLPVVGMAASPSGRGYRMVASDGGVFSFGDARFFGSTGAMRLNKPVVGMAATPSGNGYWMVGSDGGIFAFGDAPFRGSTGGMKINSPAVGLSTIPAVVAVLP
ncbi:MAG TPA: integrin alpha, partial [Acidimicrobiales bacterium]|nr:integrin alpha [Acidimicrobiales bacterium]